MYKGIADRKSRMKFCTNQPKAESKEEPCQKNLQFIAAAICRDKLKLAYGKIGDDA